MGSPPTLIDGLQRNRRPAAAYQLRVLVFRAFDGVLPLSEAALEEQLAVEEDLHAPPLSTAVLQGAVDLPLALEHRPEKFGIRQDASRVRPGPPRQEVVCVHVSLFVRLLRDGLYHDGSDREARH